MRIVVGESTTMRVQKTGCNDAFNRSPDKNFRLSSECPPQIECYDAFNNLLSPLSKEAQMNALYRGFVVLLAAGVFSAATGAPVPQEEIAWVLFNGNLERPTSGGNKAVEAMARQAQQAIGANFMVWFQLDGKTWISQDRATLDRIIRLVNHRVNHGFLVAAAERTRLEDAEFMAANPSSVSESSAAELRDLAEEFQKFASAPVTATQDLSDLEKRAFALVDKISRLQSQIVFRKSRVMALRRSEDEFRQIGSERQIFSEAIAAGRAQPAP
jgi:acetolactate synthase regulatory subunit